MTAGELQRIAAAYPPEAAYTPAADREQYFTTAQRLAWDARFGAVQPQTRARTDR